jgi:hypothetical protein
MNNKNVYLGSLVVTLMIMVVPLLGAQEQNPSPSAIEQRAMSVLKNMSQYLANAERFSVTIRDGYDAVQQSGQKIEYGEVRKVTVNRPNQLRFDVERSDGQKGLVIFNGKDITVYRVARILQTTTQTPTDTLGLTVLGTAPFRLALGVGITLDWQPPARPPWR